ncbi:S8 family serine peptidase [Oryzobacter terrae]|uniref:S8 family serine peptidase n=1 Tax=Oryzobacter terrae TaxID=1620385 RepID=UPI00366C7169
MSTRPPTRDPRRRRAARPWSRRLAPGLLAAAVVPVVAVPGVATPARALPAPATAPAAATALAADGFGPGGWWWDAMGVDELQRKGTGKGITVAVVDTPIDPDVPEIAGKVARSSSPCLADGGGTMSPRSSGREAEHGTTMAAIIAGTGRGSGPGGTGIRGIAPDATLLHYAVSYPNPDREGDLACGISGPGYDELAKGVVASIRSAVADGADIINLSLVSDYDAAYGPALLEAYRAGAIVVAGTDNAGRGVMWPALGNGVVVVNPVDQKGRVYSQSVKDDAGIGFTAPGKAVNALGVEDGRWRSDVLADGSSNATALVSGGLAAMWSAHPDATANQVLQAARASVGLRRSAAGVETWFRREGSDLPRVTEPNRAYGWGIFAPADAVATDPATLPDTNPMARDIAGLEPAYADVTAATAATSAPASPSGAASPSPSGRPSASAAATPAPTAGVASSPPVFLALAALTAAAAAAGAALALRERRRRAALGGDPDHHRLTTSAGRAPGPRADGEE